MSADLCWQICSHDYLKAPFLGEVTSSDILSLCSLDWLRVKAEQASSDINHSSSMPRGCHQPTRCNLIKMGKERRVCVSECVRVWVSSRVRAGEVMVMGSVGQIVYLSACISLVCITLTRPSSLVLCKARSITSETFTGFLIILEVFSDLFHEPCC